MATTEEIKQRVDLHDLADWIGLKRGVGAKANYFRPGADEQNPSLSIYKDKQQRWAFKDHAADKHGSCIDLVMHVRGCDVAEAMRQLHDFLGIKPERPGAAEPRREKTTAEYIADKCYDQLDRAMTYLQSRGIPTATIRHALDRKTVGFNDWHSVKVEPGGHGHGGPAVAFIVRSMNPNHVVAVDMRYLDPKLNGGTKTQAQGEKHGYGWFMDLKRLQAAHTVYVVESPINALTVEAADMPFTAAFATRGVSAIAGIDWRVFQGKQVILCFDNDEPDEKGRRAGPEAAWQLHEILTSLDISALFVDQSGWKYNDVNDILKAKGLDELKSTLKLIEDCLIPGQPYGGQLPEGAKPRKSRVWLPVHDYSEYGRYRVKPDFMSFVVKKTDADGSSHEENKNLAGFRVAGISRVTIASARATMSGDPDDQPRVMFAVSVQSPRHGAALTRRVLDDDKLHNLDVWNKFGPVFTQGPFRRMVNILERTADIGARKAINFVGLAWRDGKLIVNEGADCYFTLPMQQCPYHNLTFPTGSAADARNVVQAYQRTFKNNAAALVLVWALGGHLKALLGFWPHMTLQATKGSGKSTLTKHLERTLAMTMFSGQSLTTEFRLLTSISHTSHPIGWEELSARGQVVIDKAVSMLQEAYQFTTTARGTEMTQYLICAPVLLVGEDVPVRSLIGKLVATSLTAAGKGEMLPHNLPRFPVRQWLQFLAGFTRDRIHALFDEEKRRCMASCRASGADDGAVRMAHNYAALIVAWRLLCEFTGLAPSEGQFAADALAQMNKHIEKTSGDRQPWVWIMETLLSEIAQNNFRHPFKWDSVRTPAGAEEECLLVRPAHVMDHLSSTMALREKWNGLPIKSSTALKEQLEIAEVMLGDHHERTIGGDGYGNPGRRVSHLGALSITKMEKFGLYAVRPATGQMPLPPGFR